MIHSELWAQLPPHPATELEQAFSKVSKPSERDLLLTSVGILWSSLCFLLHGDGRKQPEEEASDNKHEHI